MYPHSSYVDPAPIRKPNKLQKPPPRPNLLPSPSPKALSISPLQLALLHPTTEASAITVTTITTAQTTSYLIHKPVGTRWYSISGLLEAEKCSCANGPCGDDISAVGTGLGQVGRGVGGKYVVTFFVRGLGDGKASGKFDQLKGYDVKQGKDWWEEPSASSSRGLFPNANDGGRVMDDDEFVFAFEYEDIDLAREFQRKEAEREKNGQVGRDVPGWGREARFRDNMGWAGHEVGEDHGRDKPEEEYKLEVSISVPVGHYAVFEKIDSEDGSQVELRFEKEA